MYLFSNDNIARKIAHRNKVVTKMNCLSVLYVKCRFAAVHIAVPRGNLVWLEFICASAF